MSDASYLVVGLQESGKTTFAAALWYLLDSREVVTILGKGKHQGDFTYLEEIAKLWGDAWKTKRTKRRRHEKIFINLVDQAKEHEFRLEFSDVAGESFGDMFASRRCNPSFVGAVSSANGILLFVSARRKTDDHTILDFAFAGSPQAVNREAHPEYVAAKVPQQVQLVDLLQAFATKPFLGPLPPVAVIISAWDFSRKESPEVWLEETMPLLAQYLRSNAEVSPFAVFGVSAQGYELPKKQELEDDEPAEPQSAEQVAALASARQRALSHSAASSRITVVGLAAGPHDLTAPLVWLARAKEGHDGT